LSGKLSGLCQVLPRQQPCDFGIVITLDDTVFILKNVVIMNDIAHTMSN